LTGGGQAVPTHRAIIVTNGCLTEASELTRYLQAGDHLICADGGARHLQGLGLKPEIVVGDLDSLEPALRAELAGQGVRFETFPADKDQTDLELAIQLAIREGATEIDLFASFGGRVDQSLANLMLLTRPEWSAVPLRAIVGNELIWPLRGGQASTIRGAVGDILSLLPLSPAVHGVNLSGVKWPLHQATLHFGSTWTISNALTEATAHLALGEGLVLVIHQTSPPVRRIDDATN
jgi:thiamine pyrophosphokinase